MSDHASFRELAEKCRELAAQIDDEPTIKALLELAEEYDAQAGEGLATA